MSDVVLDASVVIQWFRSAGEVDRLTALALYSRFVRGELVVLVPPLLFLEVLNAAGRRWGWDQLRLERLASDLDLLGFEVLQPSLLRIAHWCSRGLTAYDASYVALAEERNTVVVTADEEILKVSGSLAQSLASAAGLP